MSPATRQSWLLGILLIVLVAVVAYQLREPEPAAAPPAASNPLAGGQAGTAAARGEVTDVQLELLSTEPAAFRSPRRDPFRFRARAPAAVARRPEPPPPLPPQPPPPQRPLDERPPISGSIRLIGIYEIDGTRVAVLHDGTPNHPPIHKMAGDVVEGRYRLLRVGDDFVEMSYLDGGKPQPIPLSAP